VFSSKLSFYKIYIEKLFLMNKPRNSTLTYAEAGVNISVGNEFVQRIKPIAAKTKRPEVLAGLGGFGALFELPLNRYQQPILVSSTDGVGTKLKLALALAKHDTIGIDLVAMCVNDIIVQGAEPLFFLDYYATGHLTLEIATEVLRGIGLGCEQAGAALIGGETAEMPGVYQGSDYDLAGFSVGIVEKSQLLDGSKVAPGDAVIGIASSGVHANGFSLVRKILELNRCDLQQAFDHTTLGEALLRPTRIYVKPLLQLLQKMEVHCLAHITGGGLVENIPRVLPPKTMAQLKASTWAKPAIFEWIQAQGNISDAEMYRTFNCGVGMVACVAKDAAQECLQILKEAGETAWIIGEIRESPHSEPHVVIHS
jgi:phosphoribosylformylglycinamidine cyclo-ligase